MPAAEYLKAEDLVRAVPGAECCDCAKSAEDALDDELWVLWRGLVYCLGCASHENIGPDD